MEYRKEFMEKKTKTPRVEINTSEITKAVQEAVFSCYGIVGFADKASIARVDNKTKKGIKEDAIFITKHSNNTFEADVYLLVSQEVKLTETLVSAQMTIKYNLDRKFSKKCRAVNVYAEDVSSK